MSSKNQIVAIQQRLIVLGYDLGKAGADGVLGRRTTSAIADFQAKSRLDIKYPGTLGPKTIEALKVTDLTTGEELDAQLIVSDPVWMIESWRRVGLQEVRDNTKLREYLKSDGTTLGDPAKLPWCGDYIETITALTLPHEPLPGNPYYALNWREFGVPIEENGMVPYGAYAPFKRPGGGHIANVVGHDKTNFFVLGGNQSNKISVVAIEKDRLSGMLRWPKTYAYPTVGLPHSTMDVAISHNEA